MKITQPTDEWITFEKSGEVTQNGIAWHLDDFAPIHVDSTTPGPWEFYHAITSISGLLLRISPDGQCYQLADYDNATLVKDGPR